MSPVRRTTAAAPAPPPQPVGELLDLFNPQAYSGGRTIPEGDYALEFIAMMEPQPQNQNGNRFAQRPGVMLVAHPLKGGEPVEQFISLGKKAVGSWVPTEDGKGFAKVAGGPGIPPNNKSNWVVLFDSMIQCGMPTGLGSSLTAIDGMWAHITPTPPPEERKSFRKQAATGEAGDEEQSEQFGERMIPNVTEILEGGKPWEGGGGFPSAGQPVARPAAAPKGVDFAKMSANRKAAAAPPPPPAAEVLAGDEEDLGDIVNNAVATVLSDPKHAKSVSRLILRTTVFGTLKKDYDDATAQEAVNTFLSNDEALSKVLGPMGYKLNGSGPQALVIPQ